MEAAKTLNLLTYPFWILPTGKAFFVTVSG